MAVPWAVSSVARRDRSFRKVEADVMVLMFFAKRESKVKEGRTDLQRRTS